MKFEQKKLEGMADAFFASVEEARFATWSEWSQAAGQLLSELEAQLGESEVAFLWETLYARRADEAEHNHLGASASACIARAKELLLSRAEQYISFSIFDSDNPFGDGRQFWSFNWSGIEADPDGRPRDEELARHFDAGTWSNEMPQPGGHISRTRSTPPQERKDKALALWAPLLGGTPEDVERYVSQIFDEDEGDDPLGGQ